MTLEREALEVLKSGGWAKGAYNIGNTHCLVGALRKAAVGTSSTIDILRKTGEASCAPKLRSIDEATVRVATVLSEQYPDRFDPNFNTIPHFNDHPDTTFEDVERVLSKAAILAEEQL